MKRIKLKNRLTLLIDKRNTDSVAINATVKVGSNFEDERINGISHFIEHMLFEGSKKRKTTKKIAESIENVGGKMNALTSNDRTSYYLVIINKYFDLALDVLSDMLINPLFKEESIKKEKKVVLNEVHLWVDDPKLYQFILFVKKLFKNHPTKRPVYGSIKSVKNLKRKDLIEFYKKYYVPQNTILSIAGNVEDNVVNKVEKAFKDFKGNIKEIKFKEETEQKVKIDFSEKRKIIDSYMTIGYKVANRYNKDSYVLDIINAILSKGFSGRLFEEIRNKRGLAYGLGSHYEAGRDFGYFLVYIGCNKKNLKECKKIILNLYKLKNLSNKEISEAKQFIEGHVLLDKEDNSNRAEWNAFWYIRKKNAEDYIKEIKKVSKADIKKVINKYFKNYTCVIIGP